MAAVAVHIGDKDAVAASYGDTVILIDHDAITDCSVVCSRKIKACNLQLNGHSVDHLDAPSLLCEAGKPFERAFGA